MPKTGRGEVPRSPSPSEEDRCARPAFCRLCGYISTNTLSLASIDELDEEDRKIAVRFRKEQGLPDHCPLKDLSSEAIRWLMTRVRVSYGLREKSGESIREGQKYNAASLQILIRVHDYEKDVLETAKYLGELGRNEWALRQFVCRHLWSGEIKTLDPRLSFELPSAPGCLPVYVGEKAWAKPPANICRICCVVADYARGDTFSLATRDNMPEFTEEMKFIQSNFRRTYLHPDAVEPKIPADWDEWLGEVSTEMEVERDGTNFTSFNFVFRLDEFPQDVYMHARVMSALSQSPRYLAQRACFHKWGLPNQTRKRALYMMGNHHCKCCRHNHDDAPSFDMDRLLGNFHDSRSDSCPSSSSDSEHSEEY